MPPVSNKSSETTTHPIKFILDQNLELPVDEKPLSEILSQAGIVTEETKDLVHIDQMLADHGPDIAYIPGADFCVMLRKGNQYYRGLAISTSKFTGEPTQRTLLVVRKDDPANSFDDLAGAEYGYMNKSCSSSYFPPAIMLHQQGKKLDEFFKIQVVPGWQPRVDAVLSKAIRATMILEDVWKTTPKNAQNTKIIGQYELCPPAILVVHKKLDEKICKTLLDYLLTWQPEWKNVYGAFRPYYFADVETFYHDLSELPENFL